MPQTKTKNTTPRLFVTQTRPKHIFWRVIETPSVTLLAGIDETNALRCADFMTTAPLEKILSLWQKRMPHASLAPMAATDFAFTQIALMGTAFQISVWQNIATIPLCQTRTYAEIAAQIGRAGACRAVGTACGANPVPYFIPCHRVVGSHGALGGFGGGLPLKKKMLAAEGLVF